MTRAGPLLALALLAAAAVTLLGPPPGHDGPPHVLLITIDTVRADHCSVYGYDRPTTPTLEALAAGGVVFEHAYAPMATTAPAHASLFTGLAPVDHGIIKNGLILGRGFRTLAERLAAAGYDTAAVVSSFAVHSNFGLHQGFATYDDHFNDTSAARWHWEGQIRTGGFDRDGRLTTHRSLRWLRGERDPARPFFLWIHYFDPHYPYDPPPPYDQMFVGDDSAELADVIGRYDGEIREMDDSIGELLAALDDETLAATTLVVVAGDHGEGLMDHGWMHHGLHLYEEAVRVPLVVRLPDAIPAGRRIAEPVQLADLMPTILELAGLAGGVSPADDARPGAGISLVPALTGAGTLDAARPIYLQRRRYDDTARLDVPVRGEKRAVRLGPWKYLEAPDEDTVELYHLLDDPDERHNLAEVESARAKRLSGNLAYWRQRERRANGTRVDAMDAARLRVLGYVD